jgi:hypothetical protein
MRTVKFALLLVLVLALGLPAAAQAKKKKGGNVFSKQVTVNAPIPDRPPGAGSVSGAVTSTITVPKSFKGKVVKDLNVTNLQETGTAGATPIQQLSAALIAPNGRLVILHEGIGFTALGPMTIDDDTVLSICFPGAPICADPTQGVYPPFASTVNTIHNFNGGFPPNGPLASFDGLKMKGTWTLQVSDNVNTQTSTLNQWGLRITGKKG